MDFNHSRKTIIYLHKNDLIPLVGNPRRVKKGGEKETLAKLREQIKKHDFQNPLNVFKEETGKYTILCGNHRYAAASDLMDRFPCVVYEGDKKAALARAISDNKTSEWTEFDIKTLDQIFSDINIDMTAFTIKEAEQIKLDLEDLESIEAFKNEDFESLIENRKEDTENEIKKESTIICPKCKEEIKL